MISDSVSTISPLTLGGIAMLLVAALLCLLYFYRRRTYIVCWVGGWVVTSMSMLLASRPFASEKARLTIYGISQFVAIVGGLGFVLAADVYRARLRLVRNYLLVLLPLFIWFALAPIALRAGAAFTPGHLLIAGTLTAAGLGHLSLLRQARMLGAVVVGTGLIAIACSHLWLIVGAGEASTNAVARQTFIELALYLAVALGMQLMAFEDMTYELRMTNTQLADAQQELRQLVTTDALTGCRNRRYFDQVIVREMRRHHRYHIPLSLVFIDVDRFKTVNDTLGHEAGDRLLQRVAGFLIRKVREVDYVFRWGGDEFLILMSCREEEAVRKARELQNGFAASVETEDLPAGVGLSVGCVEVSPESEDVMALVKVADERMYEDKKR